MSRFAAVGVIAACTWALTGCSAEEPKPPAAAQGNAAKWGQCMRDHGVDIADPTEADLASGLVKRPAGVADEALNSALAACSAARGDTGKHTQGELDKFVADAIGFAKCMREQGVPSYPDPSGPGVLNGQAERDAGFDRDNPTPVQAKALKFCQDKWMPYVKKQEVG